LLVTELIVFAWLNTEPIGESFTSQPLSENVFLDILFVNLRSSIFTIIFGSIPFGVGTFFAAYMTVTSLIAQLKYLLPEIGLARLSLCVLPHGPFELTAIFLSILLSVLWSRAITLSIIQLLRRKPTATFFKEEGRQILKTAFLVLFPLITFAALIEATVSKWVTGVLL